MKKTTFLILFGFVILTSCQDVNSLVKVLAKENVVECEYIGLGGNSSKLHRKFERLKRDASAQELIRLLNHESDAVVVYSSYAILDREIIPPSELFGRFVNSNNQVSTFCGCIANIESLSSQIYLRYRSQRVEYPNDFDYENFVVNDSKELQKMDSLVLYATNPDQYLLSFALENRVYDSAYATIIEEWAFIKENYDALTYVFNNSFQGNEDELLRSLSNFLKTIEDFEYRKVKVENMLNYIKNRT